MIDLADPVGGQRLFQSRAAKEQSFPVCVWYEVKSTDFGTPKRSLGELRGQKLGDVGRSLAVENLKKMKRISKSTLNFTGSKCRAAKIGVVLDQLVGGVNSLVCLQHFEQAADESWQLDSGK